MADELGRTVALSPARRIICDLLEAGKRLPLVPIERTINLADLAWARQNAQPRPSVALRITFDHRVMDGLEPSQALVDLEQVLQGAIFNEVVKLGPVDGTKTPLVQARNLIAIDNPAASN